MAYLHEMALKKAIQKLYLLGSSDAPRDKTTFDEGMEAAGAGLGNMIGTIARPNAKAPQGPKPPTDQEKAKYNQYVQATGAPVGLGQELVKAAMKNLADKAKADQEVHDAAAQTRINGIYSPKALELTDITAQKDAEDRLRARALIQMSPGVR